MEPGDVHYIDLPKECAAAKVLKWNERIAKGYTGHHRSTTYVIGTPKSGNTTYVGVYVRKNPATN